MRLSPLLEALGPAGVAACGVLVFAIAFYAGTIRPAERDLGSLRLAVERGAAPVAGGPRAAELQRFYLLFPTLDRLPEELQRLYALARGAGVELQRADYRLEESGSPLAAYRLTLPLRAPYPRLREFIGSTLQSMPAVAIDALRLERKKTDAPEVDAQLSLTIFFRDTNEDGPR